MNSATFIRLARRSIAQAKNTQRGGHGHYELGTSEYHMNPSLQAGISLTVKLTACALFFAYPFAVIKYQRSKKESA